MPKLHITTRSGVFASIEGDSGHSVMEILRDNGFDEVLAICGGCASCATCHIYVDPKFIDLLPPVGNDERDLLEMSEHRKLTSRLACQIQFSPALDGLDVTIAPEN